MKKSIILGTLTVCLLLSGCQALEKKHQVGAAVELNGHYLYRHTLDSLTLGLESEDSLRVVEQYIHQWAQDILLYDNATMRTNEQIENRVAEYRRTLYLRAYEERLVDKRMPKQITDSTISAIYEQLTDRFKLDESIMRGLLVVVPKDAPKMPQLRKMLTEVMTDQSELRGNKLDAIEKYAYQNASGYELFTDKWLTATEVISHIPMERADLETRLKSKNQIEVSDSTKINLLQITAKHMRGEAMPIEYARAEIEKIVLYSRQVEFLRQERERLYNEAIKEQKIKFYE